MQIWDIEKPLRVHSPAPRPNNMVFSIWQLLFEIVQFGGEQRSPCCPGWPYLRDQVKRWTIWAVIAETPKPSGQARRISRSNFRLLS